MWLGGLLGLLYCAPVLAQQVDVLLVTSGRSAPYLDFTEALQQRLPAAVRLSVRDADDEQGDLQRYDLVLTVGVAASIRAAADSDRPLLAVMLPSNRYAELQARRGNRGPLSAIFIDQPLARQARVLSMVLPGSRKVGLLHSSGLKVDHGAWRSVLAVHGAQLVDELAAPASLSGSLERVLAGSDVLLAVPDHAIYNGSNIRNILLSCYRYKVPLIGLSRSYVAAGALYAVFSTPEQLAEQAAGSLRRFIDIGKLPPPGFPEHFSVEVNREVARMLGIFIRPEDEIRAQAAREEGRP